MQRRPPQRCRGSTLATQRRRRHDPGRQRPERNRDRRRRGLGGQQPRRHGLADRPGHEHGRPDDRRRGRAARDRLRGRLGLGRELARRHRSPRIDAAERTGRPSTFPVAASRWRSPSAAGSLWVASQRDDAGSRLDPHRSATGKRSSPRSASGTDRLGVAFGARRRCVGRRTASTARSPGSIPVDLSVTARRFATGDGPVRAWPSIARGTVWVSNQFGGTLIRIDPSRTFTVARRRGRVGGTPLGLRRCYGRRCGSPASVTGRRDAPRRDAQDRAPTASGTTGNASWTPSTDTLTAVHVPSGDCSPSPTTGSRAFNGGSAVCAGDPARPGPRGRAADAHERREDVHIQASSRPLLERATCAAGGLPARDRAELPRRRGLEPPLHEHRRRGQVRNRPPLRPLARDRRRRRAPHDHLPPDQAGPQLPLQARVPVRLRAAGRRRRGGRAGTHPLPATGPLHDRDLQPEETAQVRPQPVLPRMVAGRPAETGSRTASIEPHRRHRRTRRFADVRATARPMSCGWPTVDPVAACRGSSSSTRARSTPTRGRNLPGALPQHPRPRRSTGSTPGRAVNLAVDRAAAGDAPGAGRNVAEPTLPGPAAELPRLPPLLPVHGRLDEERHVDGTRPGEGEGARRTPRGDARHEGHRLGVVPAGKGLQPGGREGAALRSGTAWP